MNCQEIKDYALKKTGLDDIPDGYVISYINETMDSLAVEYDSARKKIITNIAGIKDEWIDLPSDCLAVKRCFKGDNNYVFDDYIVENGQIQFMITDTYKVEYLAMNPHVAELINTPSINIMFHETLAIGVAYKEANRIFMYDNEMIKVQLFQEYTQAKYKANSMASIQKRSRKRMKFAPFI